MLLSVWVFSTSITDELCATKISSTKASAASKRVGKGFAAKDNADIDTQLSNQCSLSPPASSEADLGLAELAQAGTE